MGKLSGRKDGGPQGPRGENREESGLRGSRAAAVRAGKDLEVTVTAESQCEYAKCH